MEHIADQLALIPGVVAVVLGGSRARGDARPDSDWDFGLYYSEPIDPRDVRALGWPGEVTGPGGWGPVVDGGAWLTVEGERVDLCYRSLVSVLRAVALAAAGEFRIEMLATFVAGIPSYVVVGELDLCKVLKSSVALPRPGFPPALAETAPPRWRHLRDMSLQAASAHALRADTAAVLACLGEAAICESQARFAERRQWALNEKGIIAKAGLDSVGPLMTGAGSTPEQLGETIEAVRNVLSVR